MSIFKRVMKAVKKLFMATVKRRPAKKRVAKKPAKKSKPQKSTRRPIRPAAPPTASKPVKAIQKKPAAPQKAVSRFKAAQSPKAKTPVAKEKPAGVVVGEVTHYFDRIKVCVIRIDREHIKKGDRLLIKGPKGEVGQDVSSMQIENEDVTSAKKGQMIGLKVVKPVFVKDQVYKAVKN